MEKSKEVEILRNFCILSIILVVFLFGYSLYLGVTKIAVIAGIFIFLQIFSLILIRVEKARIALFIHSISSFVIVYVFNTGADGGDGLFYLYLPLLTSLFYNNTLGKRSYTITLVATAIILISINLFSNQNLDLLALLINNDNRAFVLHVNIAIVFGGMILGLNYYNNIIIEQRKVLERAEANLRGLIDNTNNVLSLVDNNFNLIGFNESFKKMHQLISGLEPQINSNILNTFSEENAELWEEMINSALMGEKVTSEGELVVGDEKRFFIHNLKPVYEKNKIIGAAISSVDITEVVKTREDAELTEKRWHYALTGSRDVVWDRNFVTGEEFYSKEIYSMLGLDRLRTKRIFWETLVHPEDLERVKQAFNNHIKGETDYYEAEYRMQKQDGEYIWVVDHGRIAESDLLGNPVRCIGTITDITEKRKLEAKSRENENFLQSIVQNVNAAIYRSNEKGDIIYVNRFFYELFGYGSLDELRDAGIYALYNRKEDRKQIFKILGQNKMISNREILFQKMDGTTFWGLLSATIVELHQGEFVIDGVIRDIDELKKIEIQLLEAKENAEKASRSKSLFLSTMSHELRTPMNAVIGITSLLTDEELNESQQEIVKTLKFSADNLMYIINDILDFSKIDAGKIEFEEAKLNLETLVDKIWKMFEKTADDKGIMFEYQIDKNIPESLLGDQVRLGQVISNNISNAIKFTESGFVKLEISLVEEAEESCLLNFEISDSGIGIAKENLENIFDAFVQASSETSRKYGGTGLGLAISRRLVELMGSTINVESIEGVGSKFFYRLRFKKYKEDQRAIKLKHKEKPQLLGFKILLVEDNLVNVFVAKKYFTKWGVSFDLAENGLIGVYKVKQDAYDLVLMDIQMPVMDGIQATLEIRKFNSEIPIFAISANVLNETAERALAAGMNDYIHKPFDPDRLYEKLAACRALKSN